MTSYLFRRLLLAIPTLLIVLTIVFFLLRVLPGDPARSVAGPSATAAEVDHLRTQLGLDRPIWLQYVVYLADMARLNLGNSTLTQQPVVEEIAARFPYTLLIASAATAVSLVIGVGLGMLAARFRGGRLDLLISAVAVGGLSIPVFWLGMMLIILFSVILKVLPPGGATHPLGFVLPTLTLAVYPMGVISRISRSAILEVSGKEFVRTAKAKGVGSGTILVRHVLRNSSNTIATVTALQFGGLLGGAVLTESVFGWPGVGRLLVDSILNRDYLVVQGIILLFSACYILVNIVTDVAYGLIDSRVRYE